jgi:hypothetical protein
LRKEPFFEADCIRAMRPRITSPHEMTVTVPLITDIKANHGYYKTYENKRSSERQQALFAKYF